ncbi:MAG: ABC transporter substrate-binding protein [Clostridia bacterium]|nr:ABC transporter substrate-binding protein [Clostridia bacterium]
MNKNFKRLGALMLCAGLTCSLVACGGGEVDENFKDNDEFYTIKWYMPVNTIQAPADLGTIQQKVNEYLRDKINAAVDITAYNFSEYAGKMNTKTANAEPFDLIWTDFESIARYNEMEALYPLDSLLPEYAPNAWAKFPEEFWDQVRNSTDGKIYSVINNQILPRSFGMEVRDNDYYKEYLLASATTVLNKSTTDPYEVQDYVADNYTLASKLDFMENYLAWLRTNKSGENESCGGITWGMELLYVMEGLGFDSLGMSMAVPGVVRADETGKPTVINQFETEEFLTLINKMAEWYQEGWIPADIAGGSYSQTSTDMGSSRTWTPNYVTSFTQGGKKRYREVMRFGDPNYIASYISGTMWSVSATSENPARTLKFIDLLHTDSYLHNLLKLGVEGTHYTVDDNGQAHQESKSSRYNLEGVRWIFGDETIGITLDTQAKDVYEQVKKINEETPLSQTIGFSFDRTDVMTEIQLSSQVVTKYISNLGCGEQLTKDTDYYNDFITELKANYCDEVIAEKQRQLDAWLASK